MDLGAFLGDTVGARTYYGLLAVNLLVASICLAAGPRRWARRLCASASQVNILLLLFAAAAGAEGGAIKKEDYGLFLGLLLPLVAEFLALLAISRWRLGDTRFPWVPR